jgi:PadR family transcriptional regulator, regulatory protein PadR
MSKPSDLVRGTLNVLILRILKRSHSTDSLVQRLKQVSNSVSQVGEGSLYPALHRLEQEGWITSEWRSTENNRRAKFYSLTPPGRRQLAKETAEWNRLSDAISQVLGLKGG